MYLIHWIFVSKMKNNVFTHYIIDNHFFKVNHKTKNSQFCYYILQIDKDKILIYKIMLEI